jgi:hypothetical protein
LSELRFLLTLPSLSSNIAESPENGIGLVDATCVYASQMPKGQAFNDTDAAYFSY